MMSTSALLRLLLAPGKFVEGDDIPVADQSDPPFELLTNSFGMVTSPPEIRLPVWRKLRVDVRFTGPFGPKFDDVVVSFARRGSGASAAEACCGGRRLSGLKPIVCIRRSIHSSLVNCARASLIPSKSTLRIWIGLMVSSTHGDVPRPRKTRIGHQQYTRRRSPAAWVRFDRAAIHRNLFDAQVVERGFVAVGFFVQRDADLVDDLVAALFLDRGLDQPASLL